MNDFDEEKTIELSGRFLKLIRESGVSLQEGLAALKSAEQVVTQKASYQMIMDAYLKGFKGTEQ